MHLAEFSEGTISDWAREAYQAVCEKERREAETFERFMEAYSPDRMFRDIAKAYNGEAHKYHIFKSKRVSDDNVPLRVYELLEGAY